MVTWENPPFKETINITYYEPTNEWEAESTEVPHATGKGHCSAEPGHGEANREPCEPVILG